MSVTATTVFFLLTVTLWWNMEADDQGETGRSVGTKCDRDNSDQQESRGKDKSKVASCTCEII